MILSVFLWLPLVAALLIILVPGSARYYRSVAVAAAIGWRRSPREGLICAAMVCVSYPMVHYAGEARGYAPMLLAALAVQQNSAPFLTALYDAFGRDKNEWQLAPLTLVEQGRVAIGDEVGALLNADAVLVMVGERPGLSSPDSLGLYMTWAPEVGLKDDRRNCISNLRPAGLAYEEAARRLLLLLTEARERKLSGVKLKDRSEDSVLEGSSGSTRNFLVAD